MDEFWRNLSLLGAKTTAETSEKDCFLAFCQFFLFFSTFTFFSFIMFVCELYVSIERSWKVFFFLFFWVYMASAFEPSALPTSPQMCTDARPTTWCSTSPALYQLFTYDNGDNDDNANLIEATVSVCLKHWETLKKNFLNVKKKWKRIFYDQKPNCR